MQATSPVPRAALAALSLLALLSCLAVPVRGAEFLLHPLFTDHGVLQRELPVPVWGWGEPGAEVVVEFADQRKETKVEENGSWLLTLDPLPASSEPTRLVARSGATALTVSDLLVGEVWLCSGQSNMAMSVNRCLEDQAKAAEAAAEAGEFGQIRLFKVPVAGADERADTVGSQWQPCSAAGVATFSATGFFFGQSLHEALGVPVGLVQSANGGTNAYSWINTETFAEDPAAAPARGFWEQAVATFPQASERYEKALAAWRGKVAEARAAGRPSPAGRPPQAPLGPGHVKRPAGHYNAMIAPLQPYAIRGAIWYQGEANSRPPFATQYRDLMFALVEDWRSDWAAAIPGAPRREFPFYLVQLPNFGGGHPQGWPAVREQMLRFWQEGEATGMVVAIDVGEAGDIHPRDKKPVGERLARFARAQAYGEDLVAGGPIYRSMRAEGGKAVLSFDHVGGGLVSRDGEALRHFEAAGEDGAFVPATAEIVGETVVVSAPGLAELHSVRYAWSNNPEGINFANREGLPASPFRTDDLEIVLD